MQGYLQTIWEQFDWQGLLSALQRVLGVLLCLTVHETSHGLAAYALGDPTAMRMRRLSLNPLHHIDWLGLASMLLCGFGWAKPVPVDMRYFKHPRAGMAVTALAGPASNFLLALGALFLASLIFRMAAVGAGAGVAVLLPAVHGNAERGPGAVQPDPHSAPGRVQGALRPAAGPGLLCPHAL